MINLDVGVMLAALEEDERHRVLEELRQLHGF